MSSYEGCSTWIGLFIASSIPVPCLAVFLLYYSRGLSSGSIASLSMWHLKHDIFLLCAALDVKQAESKVLKLKASANVNASEDGGLLDVSQLSCLEFLHFLVFALDQKWLSKNPLVSSVWLCIPRWVCSFSWIQDQLVQLAEILAHISLITSS